MSKAIHVAFPGGVAVDALVGEHRIRTDQPVSQGGEGGAPSPFQVFLGSLAACAGFFAIRFCQQREISTEGLGLRLEPEWNRETHRLESLRFELTLPPGFPEKYRPAILRAIDQCSVKRAMMDPPEMEVVIEEAEPA